jgi:hypothetical protein
MPDCAARPSDCADVAVLNTLDGFNVQPRLSMPFDGLIDVSTVSSDTVFLADASGRRVGVNQVVWQPAATTLHAESDELLRQGTSYLLVVTDGVKAADGSELDADSFLRDLNFGQTKDPAAKDYRKRLQKALYWSGVPRGHIVAASLFTTQSVTALSEKIRRQLDAPAPAPATFAIGTNGERAVFPVSSVLGLVVTRHTGTAPTFTTSTLPAAVPVVPGAIGTVAFGRYRSPDYETAAKVIPAYGTATGTPVPQSTSDVWAIIEIARLSPSFRSLVGLALLTRTPSLYNAVPDPSLQNFVENVPLRDQPPLVDTVPGASAIQESLDRSEWAQQAANPVAYAPHLRADPLDGVPAKAVIVQFAKGDRTVPNPTTSAISAPACWPTARRTSGTISRSPGCPGTR